MPISINGSGTITGISAGGLPDASVTVDDIANGAVTPAKLSTGAPTWDSSSRLLVGTATAVDVFNYLGVDRTTRFQVSGADANEGSMALIRTNAYPIFYLAGGSSGVNVNSGSVTGALVFSGYHTSKYYTAADIRCEVDGTPGANDMPGRLVFSVTRDSEGSPKEALRIDNQGRVTIGTANTVSGIALSVYGNSTSDNDGTLTVGNANTTAAACVASFYTGTNSTATSNVLIKFGINGYASGSGQINANGASAAAFGTFSDVRLKENIKDLPSQWDNIKSLRPVEFDYVESFGGGHQIGFIAQEMQTVYPDVVGIGEDEMLTVTAWSKTEARLVRALQEALERIEALEAEVAALKAA